MVRGTPISTNNRNESVAISILMFVFITEQEFSEFFDINSIKQNIILVLKENEFREFSETNGS